MKSWRTSTLGIVAILSAVASVASALLDGNPATNPDWTVFTTSVAAGWGLMTARDNRVTSEQAGAK